MSSAVGKLIAVVVIAVIVVVAALIGVYYYFSIGGHPAIQSIEFGTSTSVSQEFIPAYVAQHGGFWKQQGLNVTVVPFTGDPAQMKAVASGQLQIGITGVEGGLIAATTGAKFETVAIGFPQADMSVVVLKNSTYTDPAQLRGATIAVNALGGLEDIMVHILASHYNMTLGKDIHEVAVGSVPAEIASLVSNKVQAIMIGYAQGYILEYKGAGRILTLMSSIVPSNWMTETLYASDALISNHPDLVKKVLQGWFNAVGYLKSNETYAVQMTSQYMNVPSSVAQKIVGQAFFGPGNFSSNGQFTSQAIAALNYVRTTMLGLNITSNIIPVSQYYTTQFVPVSQQNVAPYAVLTSNLDVASTVGLFSSLVIPAKKIGFRN
ncbi:MAG: ABC transporter substrate-binding protein [Nitrososphaerota archaeon]|nr:ABC transporter substrate-binding protein [Nitrososphaerota archaeon]